MMAVVGVLTFLAPQVFLVQLALWLGAVVRTGYIGWCAALAGQADRGHRPADHPRVGCPHPRR